jgi:hypothetical protein
MNRLCCFFAVVFSLVLSGSVPARPAYRKALADLLQLHAASKLNDCRTCHLPLKPGADESDRPHNVFGARLKAVRAELKKAGKPHDITARLLAVAAEDSDGDGVANLLELLAGSFPGDPSDRPSVENLAVAGKRQALLLASLRGHRWRPFDRVERPSLPVVRDFSASRNPIDVFLAAEHEKSGLTTRPEAPREDLLRRLTLDLTGLPPTTEELHAFMTDRGSNAYEKVVDRLLASPRYGERWGRHWMDVWRYSDWAGFGAQVRDSQPHIWHWRDWIVESLNEGKGYDRMVVEMLAADEITPTDNSALRATGFLVRNYKLLSREKWLQDAVDHTAQAFLGITLGCARCHDHMYDPLTQKEYYRVRAIFTPHNVRIDRLLGWPDTTKNGLPRVYDADLKAPTYLLLRGDDRTPDKTALSAGVPEALGGSFNVEEIKLPRYASMPERRPFVVSELIANLERTVTMHDADMAVAEWRARLGALSAGLTGKPATILGGLAAQPLLELDRQATVMACEAAVEVVRRYRLMAEVEQLEDAGRSATPEWEKAARALVVTERRFAYLKARNRFFMLRHGLVKPDPKVKLPLAKQLADAEKAVARAEADLRLPPSTKYTSRPMKVYPAASTGRRLALARWIAHRDNPLAARVAVNHVWLRHFGQALVPSVFDFGRNGQPPSHPALLDWLAVEFMERGWNLKALHRLIVTSSAYQRDSKPDAAGLARDPDNVYLWRFAPRRVEAEVVRDTIFFLSGRLDSSMGGPDIPHSQGLVVPRRSLYFQHAAEKQMEFLRLFDGASVTECYERRQAIMPQQALALANSDLTLKHARLTARRLHTTAGKDSAAFVRLAFEHILSRRATQEENATCLAFLQAQAARLVAARPRVTPPDGDGAAPASDPALRARENLVHVLFNHHEFMTIR